MKDPVSLKPLGSLPPTGDWTLTIKTACQHRITPPSASMPQFLGALGGWMYCFLALLCNLILLPSLFYLFFLFKTLCITARVLVSVMHFSSAAFISLTFGVLQTDPARLHVRVG